MVAPGLNAEGLRLPPRMTLDPGTREGPARPPLGRGKHPGSGGTRRPRHSCAGFLSRGE